MPNFRAVTSLVALYSQTYTAAIRENYHESSDCFEYAKKSYLTQASHQKLLAKFSHQKNPGIKNFKLTPPFSSPGLELGK